MKQVMQVKRNKQLVKKQKIIYTGSKKIEKVKEEKYAEKKNKKDRRQNKMKALKKILNINK